MTHQTVGHAPTGDQDGPLADCPDSALVPPGHEPRCPVDITLAALGGRWTPLVVREFLRRGQTTYSELSAARRAELDELEEQLAKQLAEVRAERNELAVAERVLERVSEQLANERASVTPAPGQVGGRAVMLIPHRTSGVEESTLPPDYQRILAAVRQAAGPVMARQVGDALGIDVSVRAKLEPLRGRLVRLVDRGWLRKLPDGRFTTCL
ncbi:hypothetical protein GCM10023196_099060 [Actinoallomurus vinaceus]|uniref:Uncharacterized protein n=1 Tax=Actinoallomurus vinaceus TaxID=1080074 RepID=A0ABP8UUG0_9ACTN